MKTRTADIIRSLACAERGLCADQHVFALQVRDRLPQHLFAAAFGVDIGCIEEVTSCFHADVDQLARFFAFGVAPRCEELVAGPKRAGAEAKLGNFEAGTAKCAVFHLWRDAGKQRHDAKCGLRVTRGSPLPQTSQPRTYNLESGTEPQLLS